MTTPPPAEPYIPAALRNLDLNMLATDLAGTIDQYADDYAGDNPAAKAALNLIGEDHLVRHLPGFLAAILRDVANEEAVITAASWTPPLDAPRTHAGGLKHTCNSDNASGLPFGKLAAPGACARCDERRYTDAPARPDHAAGRRNQDAVRSAELRAHFDSANHLAGNCGLVCTFGEW